MKLLNINAELFYAKDSAVTLCGPIIDAWGEIELRLLRPSLEHVPE